MESNTLSSVSSTHCQDPAVLAVRERKPIWRNGRKGGRVGIARSWNPRPRTKNREKRQRKVQWC